MRVVAIALLSAVVLAGCSSEPAPEVVVPTTTTLAPIPSVVPAVPTPLLAAMNFTESVVDDAVDFTGDLYEPTIEVCDTGTVYITAHTILVDTTGAPVYFSKDDGASWSQLPFAGPVTAPGPVQGATPPPSDEIFLSCGDDGWLYGVDITLATFPVNAWSGDGAQLAYHNPNAYDEGQVGTQTSESCVPGPIKDRPWGAYANGKLLMVSNPASGPAQVGVLDVPPIAPVGIGATAGGGSWNLCAGPGDLPISCSIPGIPDVREDGLFVVPQICGDALFLVLGNADAVLDTSLLEVFKHSTGGEITSVYGIAAFDAAGTLYVGISNNTEENDDGEVTGQLRVATSIDGGATFVERTFQTGIGTVRHFYMDPNDLGPGALVVWAVDGDTDNTFDWYVGHLQLGHDGGAILQNVALAIDEGPQPSAHVTGAGVGPDGRAYLAMYRTENTGTATAGGTPLSVYIQQDGPTMPIATVEPAPTSNQ